MCGTYYSFVLGDKANFQCSEADSDLVCQPAARWMDINDTLQKKGTYILICFRKS